jgi:repressor LexA
LTWVRVFSTLNNVQGLTQRQQMVLDFIRQSITDRGYPPTLREIGARMGIRSTNGVNDHLRALERKGYLTREDMKSRALRPTTHAPAAPTMAPTQAPNHEDTVASTREPTIRVARDEVADGSRERPLDRSYGFLPANDDVIDVRVLGRVAAGLPLFAAEHVIDTVRVDRGLFKGGCDVFGLRVHGDSMIESGILSGDAIFVRKQPTANRGDIVVALIGDEATVKYYYPEKDYVRFQPANKSMAPILVRASDFKPTMLLGVVVGVFRRV